MQHRTKSLPLLHCALLFAALTCGPLLMSGAHATDTVDIQAMSWAAACVTCHGASQAVKGSSVALLAGQPADQLVAKMKAFANADAPGSLMSQIARGYDDEALMRIAQWYEQQGKETP